MCGNGIELPYGPYTLDIKDKKLFYKGYLYQENIDFSKYVKDFNILQSLLNRTSLNFDEDIKIILECNPYLYGGAPFFNFIQTACPNVVCKVSDVIKEEYCMSEIYKPDEKKNLYKKYDVYDGSAIIAKGLDFDVAIALIAGYRLFNIDDKLNISIKDSE